MTLIYTPIHDDKELTDKWWSDRGYTLGKNLWYNVIRDHSGRYDGYFMQTLDGSLVPVLTVTQAEALIKQSGIFPSA